MENQNKKFSFSDQPLPAKIVYAVVLLSLIASAVVICIVAARNKNASPISGDNNIVMEAPQDDTDTKVPEKKQEEEPKKEEEKQTLTFVSPCVGSVMTEHNLTVPVFSNTLGEWRVHSGVDIATEESAPVYAAAPGSVSAIYSDPLMGMTVEVSHINNFKTVYANLDSTLVEGLSVGSVLKSGDVIGRVGDTSIKELAEEPHLHFGMKIGDAAVNPLDYLSDAVKQASLGENDQTLSA